MFPVAAAPSYTLKQLPWDSAHFGFPVARLSATASTESTLRLALQQARSDGFQLVYWGAKPEEVVSATLLEEWSGRLVDRKVTYESDLSRPEVNVSSAQSAVCLIKEFPKGDPTSQLVALGVAAGEWSRYRHDPSIPVERFRSLYEIWVRRSTLRELADAVFVAATPQNEHAGMVTIALQRPAAQIGLFAVDEAARGIGIGSRLMQAAREFMVAAGARTGRVVTQLENVAACQLYERHGYSLVEVEHYYHFWPLRPGH